MFNIFPKKWYHNFQFKLLVMLIVMTLSWNLKTIEFGFAIQYIYFTLRQKLPKIYPWWVDDAFHYALSKYMYWESILVGTAVFILFIFFTKTPNIVIIPSTTSTNFRRYSNTFENYFNPKTCTHTHTHTHRYTGWPRKTTDSPCGPNLTKFTDTMS